MMRDDSNFVRGYGFCWMAPVCLLLWCTGVQAQLRATTTPTGANVVITQSSAVFVTFGLNPGAIQQTATVRSLLGEFVLLDPDDRSVRQVIGTNNVALQTTIAPGQTGAAVETLLIPHDVAIRGLKSGLDRFFYERDFTSDVDGSTARARLTCRLGSSAFGLFSIGQVTLYFDNQRGEATVEQGTNDLHAFAEVHYNGTGLFEATWEVSEPAQEGQAPLVRAIETVKTYVTYGDRILLRTPAVPGLPTQIRGQHQVALRITSPPSGFSLPAVSYFVTEPVEAPQQQVINLLGPFDNASISQAPVVFSWSPAPRVVEYRFEILEDNPASLPNRFNASTDPLKALESGAAYPLLLPQFSISDSRNVFSAQTDLATTRFSLNENHLKRLQRSKSYLWRVVGLDVEGEIVARSAVRRVVFY
jgi:hypothetical protein